MKYFLRHGLIGFKDNLTETQKSKLQNLSNIEVLNISY